MYRAGALSQIGRFDEARKALDDAYTIAGTEGKYKQLLAEINMTAARLELSDFRYPESKLNAQKALDLAVNKYPDTASAAKLILGLAETRSGASRLGSHLCTEAVEMATGTGDPQLISSAWLALAEALLESGDAQRALKTAMQAQESFARYGQQDSEWHAWVIAAQADRQLGEQSAAREHASNAAARLSSLEQRFGPEVYGGYVNRPDVQQFRKRLNEMLNS